MDAVQHLGSGAIWVMAVYLLLMVAIGFLGRASRKAETLRDFYLGGSSLGLVVLFLTLFATQYSGNTLLGFAGQAYSQGLGYVVSVTFMVLVIAVYLVYAPRLFRLSRRFGYITPADFIYHRYGSHALRILAVLLLCWGLANYILEQLVAMGHAAEALSEGRVSFMQGVLILAGVMLVYESLGGMRSVAWTDVVQGCLLLAGCSALVFALVGGEGGGVGAAVAEIAQRAPERTARPEGRALLVWISNLVLLGIGVAIYPHGIQRVFAARNLTSLRRSLALMAFMPLVTTLLAFFVGIVGFSRFPDLAAADVDKITIFVLGSIAEGSPLVRWLVILILAAVVAAIMSTADSALLSMASMVTKDIYKPYVKPDATAHQLLVLGKVGSWVLMAVLILMAWVSRQTESSLWLLIRLKLEFMVQLAPAIILGVHWRKLSGRAVLVGLCAGTAVTLGLWAGAMLSPGIVRSPLGVSAGVWGLVLNVALASLMEAFRGYRHGREAGTLEGSS